MKRGLLALTLLSSACVDGGLDARELEVANVLAKADEPLLRARPALVAGKYRRMAADSVAFVRGSLPLYRHDVRDGTTDAGVSGFALDVLVPSLGDAHPENFGTLRASDGSFALEPNDFDAADRAPYLWDVRRLAAGMALAAELSNPGDAAAREVTRAERRLVARAAAEAYASALDAAPERVVDPAGSPILEDLFSRSARDLAARRELSELTTLTDGARRMRRGNVDPEEPESVLADLPDVARAALGPAIARYRTTLLAPPPPEFFTVLDAARELGSGVASWPRVRALVVVRGPTDEPEDDVVLEVKELADSGIAGQIAPGVYHRDVGARVLAASRAAWARPDADPLWGTSDWLGLPVQIRSETEAHKSVRFSRLEGARGTPEALIALAATLGRVVARVHAPEAAAIRARIAGRAQAFADEQAAFADAYVTLQLADQARFVRALARLGPRLGVPFDPADRPSADVAALLGAPPPAPVLP